MNLLTTYFECENEERLLEYLAALYKNLENPYINHIYLFLEDEDRPSFSSCPIPPAGKITYIENSGRVTYNELLEFCNDNLSGQICIISNADIEFDETLEIIHNEDLGEHFLCLSRWEREEDGSLIYHRSADSQDCWIFNSPVPAPMTIDANFFLGQVGCDNRIAHVAKKHGLLPTNPSPIIRPIHHHLCDYRTYSWCDRLQGYYLKVWPTDNWDTSRLGEYYEEFHLGED